MRLHVTDVAGGSVGIARLGAESWRIGYENLIDQEVSVSGDRVQRMAIVAEGERK